MTAIIIALAAPNPPAPTTEPDPEDTEPMLRFACDGNLSSTDVELFVDAPVCSSGLSEVEESGPLDGLSEVESILAHAPPAGGWVPCILTVQGCPRLLHLPRCPRAVRTTREGELLVY